MNTQHIKNSKQTITNSKKMEKSENVIIEYANKS